MSEVEESTKNIYIINLQLRFQPLRAACEEDQLKNIQPKSLKVKIYFSVNPFVPIFSESVFSLA